MTPELSSVSAWRDAPAQRREDILATVGERLGLVPVGFDCYGDGTTPIGSLRHDGSGVVFRLLPGGTFRMGFSDAEYEALRAIHTIGAEWEDRFAEADEDDGEYPEENLPHYVDSDMLEDFFDSEEMRWMRPVHEVTVPPFLIGAHPLTVREVRPWLTGFTMKHYLQGHDLGPDEIAGFTEEELDRVCTVWPFHLPTEAQWEYACRAGTTTLSFGGDTLEDFVAEEDLLHNVGDPKLVAANENEFGLHCLGARTEVCADVFVPHYRDAPTDGSARTGTGGPVVRGGMLTPAQGCNEWLVLMSACRRPGTRAGAVRPVLPL